MQDRSASVQRGQLAAIGAAQGLCVWLLTDPWPDGVWWHVAAVAGLTAVFVSGLVFHFCWTGEHRGRLLALSGGVALVYALVAGWVGWELESAESAYRYRSDDLRD